MNIFCKISILVIIGAVKWLKTVLFLLYGCDELFLSKKISVMIRFFLS